MKEGSLRIYWTSNHLNKIEYYYVDDLKCAKIVLATLATHDLNLNVVSFNLGGLEVFENGEWSEWLDDNYDPINFDYELAQIQSL